MKHSTLFEKFAELSLPPHHSTHWLVDFFSNRLHCTSLDGVISTLKEITASIIQGSGLGPAAYSVNASDLHGESTYLIHCVSLLTILYLIVAGRHASTRNGMKLNTCKNGPLQTTSASIIQNRLKLSSGKSRLNTNIQFSITYNRFLESHGSNRCKILGVTISDKLSISDHIRYRQLGNCLCQSLYALKMLS